MLSCLRWKDESPALKLKYLEDTRVALLGISAQIYWRFEVPFGSWPYRLLPIGDPHASASTKRAVAEALFREPDCCLDTACSRKLRDAYTDSAEFLADDEARDLIMSWAVTGTVCSMDIERIFASIRLSVPECAPFAERVTANGTLTQVQRLHREQGGIDANTFRRSDAMKMDMPTAANVETAISRPGRARGNILFMRRAIEAERAALPDGRIKFTKQELRAIRKAASKEYAKLSQQTQMDLAEEAKNDANARAAADETLDAAPPETPFDATRLWGCASVDCPLAVDVARDAVLLKTGKAKVALPFASSVSLLSSVLPPPVPPPHSSHIAYRRSPIADRSPIAFIPHPASWEGGGGGAAWMLEGGGWIMGDRRACFGPLLLASLPRLAGFARTAARSGSPSVTG